MEKDKQQNLEPLLIFHFNDAYDIQPDTKGNSGFVNFYDYVLQLRKKHPNALLIFSGDAFAPSRLSRVFRGQQMLTCLKKLNIDLACYGNHDFDYDPAHCLKLAKQCGFPWLMGNIKYRDTGKNIGDGLDYHIMERNGIKIGFLGLAGPDFNGRLISFYKDKLKYYDISEYAKRICAILIQKQCKLIIALTHCRRPIDQVLAKNVPQIDIILGGHDHQTIYKVINQIPIIKSGSNFQYLSIVKINPLGINIEEPKLTLMDGRRWSIGHKCHLVKRTNESYPELEQYIKSAVQEYAVFEHNKSMTNNKPKIQHIQLPQDEWLISNHFINNRPAITLKAGLSAQICFAKYVAFKTKRIYVGYRRGAPVLTDNFVQDVLEYIYKQVKSHENKGKTILYAPGICSVPYLVQTGNLVYLPSHFLVGVKNIKALKNMLKIAHEKGYRCYAVLGHDPFIKNMLCAWIKFTHLPIQYLKLIEECQIQNILIMSVCDPKGNDHGSQRTARLITSQTVKNRQCPQSQDIYAMFVNESYGMPVSKDIAIFKQNIQDYSQAQWQQIALLPLCKYIYDWQSGIDCMNYLQTRIRQQLSNPNIKIYNILNPDSWKLYLIAYHLGKQFIIHNFHQQTHDIIPKGIVFNQYIMSNPSYQLNYGYVPILYWQFYGDNQKRILSVLTEEERNYKRWFNMHKGTSINLIQPDSVKIETDHEGQKLGKWVAKYGPKQYNLKYLFIQQLLQILVQHEYLYRTDYNQDSTSQTKLQFIKLHQF